MRERPDALQLIAAVTGFLRDVALPRLDGQAAFHARVAANALEIVSRELEHGKAAQAGELERLEALLGVEGDAERLNEMLCDAIAGRSIALDDPDLLNHLWATTLDALAVDQPRYETFRRASRTRSSGDM